ncbi:MAG: Ig-like domain-containing protein [Candidatus Thermoplasmatota archaeon]
MKSYIKILSFIIILILVGSSLYIGVPSPSDKDTDDVPPVISFVSRNLTGSPGKISRIISNFSDNQEVDEAILHYKSATSKEWNKKSIKQGNADIDIPEDSTENWYYYVTVDDKEGNIVGLPSTDGSKYYVIEVEGPSKELEHHVFIEEGTAGWCNNCPSVAKVIDEFYKSEDSRFYYVSLVEDMNKNEDNIARQRLQDDYNIYGFPTLYIDGGYEVILGGNDFRSVFSEKISKAYERNVPEVEINVDSSWNDQDEKLENMVTVRNYEEDSYEGRVKVYITEINSRWDDYNGEPYHYALLDYGINKKVEVPADGEIQINKSWDPEVAGFSDISPENLWVVAVLFNDEVKQRYSQPSQKKDSFDAHFSDAVSATRVSEGDLPPSVGISKPKKWMFYFRGREIGKTLFGNTLLLGKTDIETNVVAEAGVDRVEFRINGLLREKTFTDETAPYGFTWDFFSFGRYTVNVKVYDKEGRTNTDSIQVYAFIL